MADNVNNVTDSTFQKEVIEASKTQPVMVDFWAEWCRPCLMLAPTVAEVANAYAGKIKVVKLNVDENTNSSRSDRKSGSAPHRLSSPCRIELAPGP